MSKDNHVDAGELRERPTVLTLAQTDTGWEWQAARKTWASAELATQKNVWSVHGIGATGVTFLMRRQMLSLDHALQWHGHHCFITSIVPWSRNHIQVKAALVVVSSCEDKYTGTKFPGIVTEKYNGHDQLVPQAVNTMQRVLVTPKCIELRPGRLVHVGGEDWPILTAHQLDPQKNEYIIEKVVDL